MKSKETTFKNGCLLPAFIIHLASNFMHTCDFQPNLITFPLPAIIVLFANLPTLGVPSLVPSISVLVTWNAFQGVFLLLLFSLASILFSTRYLPLSFPAVSHTCSSAQEQEYRRGFVMRAASICFWMNDTQASSQQLHLTDPATVFQDEVLTVRLVREDSSTNTALRSLSQQLGSSSLLQKVQTTAMTKQTNCSSSAGGQSTNIRGTVRASQSSISQGKKFN